MHEDCVRVALTRAGVNDREAIVRALEAAVAVAERVCPRCGAALGPCPVQSHATEDTCVPICARCGHDEAAELSLGRAVTACAWPTGALVPRPRTG